MYLLLNPDIERDSVRQGDKRHRNNKETKRFKSAGKVLIYLNSIKKRFVERGGKMLTRRTSHEPKIHHFGLGSF